MHHVGRDHRIFGISQNTLQLSGRGYENWYVPTVELYHLEGQSYAPSIRRVANQYNMWLHSHIWGERITALIEGT